MEEKVPKLTLIITDLDGFKAVNDTFGHQAGDDILKDFGKILKEVMPPSATIARLGGDEFAVLLPDTSYLKASLLARLLQGRIIDCPYSLTVSFGIFTGSYDSGLGFGDFYRRADEAMYIHKTGVKGK